MKNKKGFTLVELLAVIAVLGIILTIVVVNVNKMIKEKKEKLYASTIEEIEKVASQYVASHPEALDGDLFTIDLSTLCNENYIDCPVIDPRNNKKLDGSVLVENKFQDKYIYKYVIPNLYKGFSTPLSDTNFWSVTSYITPLEDGWVKVYYDNTDGTIIKYANLFSQKNISINFDTNTKYSFLIEFRNVNSVPAVFYIAKTHSTSTDIFKTQVAVALNEITNGAKIYKTATTADSFENVNYGLRSFIGIPVGQILDLETRLTIVEGDRTDFEYSTFSIS